MLSMYSSLVNDHLHVQVEWNSSLDVCRNFLSFGKQLNYDVSCFTVVIGVIVDNNLIDFSSSRDRTAVAFGGNILSFRAIFNDVRNSVERVHGKVESTH